MLLRAECAHGTCEVLDLISRTGRNKGRWIKGEGKGKGDRNRVQGTEGARKREEGQVFRSACS